MLFIWLGLPAQGMLGDKILYLCSWLACVQDSGGQYVSKWVPEIRQLPKKYQHKPWEASPEDLQAAGITLGQTYPHRVETEKLEVSKLLEAFPALGGPAAQPSPDGTHPCVILKAHCILTEHCEILWSSSTRFACALVLSWCRGLCQAPSPQVQLQLQDGYQA